MLTVAPLRNGSVWEKRLCFSSVLPECACGWLFSVLTLRFAELFECAALCSSSVWETSSDTCLFRFLSFLFLGLCSWVFFTLLFSLKVGSDSAAPWTAAHQPPRPECYSRRFMCFHPFSLVFHLIAVYWPSLLFCPFCSWFQSLCFSVLGFLFGFWFQFSGKIFCFFISFLKQTSGGYLYFLMDDPSVWIPCRLVSAVCVLSQFLSLGPD